MTTLTYKRWPSKRWILGHRGARAIAPENTLSSFRLAMEYGADGVEFDVFLSRDGVPVVIHDDTVERTTNGIGAVQDLTAKQLADLDATKLIPGFAPEGVPSLDETLAILPEGAIANVELKSGGRFSKQEFIKKVIEILEKYKNRLFIILSSFDGELLSLFRQTDASYLLSLILSPRDEYWPSALEYIEDIAPDALHLSEDLANPLVQALARKSKMHIAIWTVNDVDKARAWFDRGVDGIFTDKVSEMTELGAYPSLET